MKLLRTPLLLAIALASCATTSHVTEESLLLPGAGGTERIDLSITHLAGVDSDDTLLVAGPDGPLLTGRMQVRWPVTLASRGGVLEALDADGEVLSSTPFEARLRPALPVQHQRRVLTFAVPLPETPSADRWHLILGSGL